ncbi:MAG: MOSC domain-containing protein [Gemmatimonadetes bacterium]|nr:MOSC domain-containing protein [Gemmatimonadota bacterium]
MRIASLHRYPIKGCRGEDLDAAVLDRLGVEGDRRLMLVDAEDRFLSQREVPQLATLVPRLDGDTLRVAVDGDAAATFGLDRSGPARSVTIWSDVVTAHDQGDDAAAWFSDVLSLPCRLVAFGSQSRRTLDPRWTPRADAETAFTDGYPLLVVTEASCEALNGRLRDPVPMDRFRPNVVVAGAEPWAEDGWREIRIGNMTLDLVKPCARCPVPTTDQRTGARHPTQEPLRTLARDRTIPGLGAIFGQNAVPRGPGMLVVGDEVVVGP